MQQFDWINRAEYPFRSQFVELDAGTIHYVDEGQGPILLMVHGTPTWSFLYRHLIKGLSSEYRCIAVDHLGFGLSGKPTEGDYRPEDHARNLHQFIERLGLRDITLMVHDFGGPIGLSYAIEQPENVQALVLFNTWMWSQRGNATVERVSRILGGPLGRVLYTRLNFSPRVLLRAAWGDNVKLTPEIQRHYTGVLATPADRRATWVLARELIGSSDWYDHLWQRRERIAGKPALLVWGMQDPTFKEAELERWQTLFTNARTVKLPTTGHFVPDEAPEIVPDLRAFLVSSLAAHAGNPRQHLTA